MVDYREWIMQNGDWLSLFVIISVVTIYTIRYITKYDEYEKEPKLRLIIAFIYGVLSVIPALILSLIMIEFITVNTSVVVAPLAEEFSKGLFVILLARSKEFDGPLDGMIYGGLVGTGFAWAQNLLYAFNALLEGGIVAGVLTASFRSVFQLVGHPFFTALFGYGVGAAKVDLGTYKWGAIWKAILTHAIWNYIAGFAFPYFILGLIVVALIFLWYLKRQLNRAVDLDKEAYERGYYTGDNVKYA